LSHSVVAQRYAKSFFTVVKNMDIIGDVEENIVMMRDVFAENVALRAQFRNPILSESQKKQIALAVFGSRLHPLTERLLHFLADKRRMSILPDVVIAFIQLLRTTMGIRDGKITSATALSAGQKDHLTQLFSEKTGFAIEFAEEVDPDLVAGFKVAVAGRVYDATLKNKLQRLAKSFKK
jgi:F-type H+-transporting ATPase subunit delta